MSSSISKGTSVRIVSSTSIPQKYHQYIGKTGTVEDFCDDKYSIKMNGFGPVKHTIKVSAESFIVLKSDNHTVAVSNNAPSLQTTRPRSNSSPGIHVSSNSFLFQEGMRVIIVGTENVLQRFPLFVGKIGIIKEAPKHPSTWFKIEFPEHRVVTFRPSAIRPVDSEGKIINIHGTRPHAEQLPQFRHASKTQASSNASSNNATGSWLNDGSLVTTASDHQYADPVQENLSQETTAAVQSQGFKKRSVTGAATAAGRRLLSMIDPETWVGQRVSLLSGKQAGHQGKVLSSGNGWVQVLTTQGEEVAKRAYELQVIEILSAGTTVDIHVKKRARFGRNPSIGSLNVQQNVDNAISSVDQSSHMHPSTDLVEDAMNPTNRSRPRAYSDSLMSASNFPTGRLLGFASSAGFQMTSSTASMKCASEIFGAVPSRSPRGPPLKNPAFVEAKKAYTTKYVNRHLQNINGRPNLVDWKQQIDVGIVNNTIFERQTAHLFEETYCEVCNLEKWSNAKFCWNESCPVSPVYFKLTGLSAPYQQQGSEVDGTCSDNGYPPQLPPLGEGIANEGIDDEKDEEELLPFRAIDLTSNIVNDYLLQLPSQIIGNENRCSGNDELLSAHASIVWDDHRYEDPAIRDREDQTVLSLAPVEKPNHDGEIQIALPFSLLRSRENDGQREEFPIMEEHRNISNDSLTSICTDGIQGDGRKTSPTSVVYSQYFCRTADRSESFAETDSEVKSATYVR